MNYAKRLKLCQSHIEKSREYSGILITDAANMRYLCGFTGSCGYLLITGKGAWFFTDFRYDEQAKKEIGKVAEIEIFYNNSIETIFSRVKACRIKKLGVERSLSLGQFLSYQEEFSGKLVPIGGFVQSLRQIKDAGELKDLKKAFAIADKAFAQLMQEIKPGMTEVEAAARLEYFMKSFGSEAPSFATIIASGPNSSCPHAQPTSKKLKSKEMVKIDFGAVYNGYHSDMTRTIFLGTASEKFKNIYAIVARAQNEAIKALKVGANCKAIDKVARDVIEKAGYGENFGHGLGHSFGLEVHELPSLSAKSDVKIAEGMTFTVEPGIYLPGWGGIRIEDSFLLKKDGKIRLTKTPNKLLEIIN